MKATAASRQLLLQRPSSTLGTTLQRAVFSQQAVTATGASQELLNLHKKQHMGKVMDPRFYENDFMAGKTEELEFIRHPFYDLAKQETLNQESATNLIDEVTMKINHIEGFEIFLETPIPTKENVAYTRYSDRPDERDPKARELFEFPRGKPYQIINNAELFRVQKWSVGEDRWTAIRRSKAFLADKFIPPFNLKEDNLRQIFADKEAYSQEGTEAFNSWKEKLLEAIPRVNHDILVELALSLSYEAKVNDKQIWRAIEDASLASLHHMNITQVSQLEWATMELKPKNVTARLNTLLQKRANESIDSASVTELMDIMQGFR